MSALFLTVTPACSSQILLQIISDSLALQEVNSYEIPLQRVLTRLSFLLRLLHLLAISGDPELLAVQSVLFRLRDVSAVRSLGLHSISVCVSSSQQVSLRFEGEMGVT